LQDQTGSGNLSKLLAAMTEHQSTYNTLYQVARTKADQLIICHLLLQVSWVFKFQIQTYSDPTAKNNDRMFTPSSTTHGPKSDREASN